MYFLMQLCQQKHRQVERPADTGGSWPTNSPVCRLACDSKRCRWSEAQASLEEEPDHGMARGREDTEAASPAAQHCLSPLVCEWR